MLISCLLNPFFLVKILAVLSKINFNSKDPICGNIGLNVIDKKNDIFQTNFLSQLKNNNIITEAIIQSCEPED